MWEGERPVPVRLILPLEARDDPEKIGAVTIPGECRRANSAARPREVAGRQRISSINREGNSRYLALKFNIDGRDMGSVVKEAIGGHQQVKPPEGHYFVWGGEFENQRRAVARLRSWCRWPCCWC